MSILKSVASARTLRAGVAVGVMSAALVGVAATQAQAATSVPKATAVPATGGELKQNVIAVTGTGFQDAAGTDVAANVEFSSAACAATSGGSQTPMVAGSLNVVSDTRLVVTTPNSLAVANSKPTAFYVCVYDGAGTPNLIGQGTYTVYSVPTITKVVPAAGPSFGGQTITVTGTNFTSKTTATIGGQALLSVKVAKDGKSFTGVTPSYNAALAGSTVDVIANNEGGDATVTTATDNDYKYNLAVTASPQTGVISGGKTLTVKGTGFTSSKFDFSATTAGKSAVIFTVGAFDNGTTSSKINNGAVARCASVTVVSDTELVCKTPDMTTKDITSTGNVAQAYTNGVALTVQVIDKFDWAKQIIGVDNTGVAAYTFLSVPSSATTYTFSTF